jgi:hypothetical protein
MIQLRLSRDTLFYPLCKVASIPMEEDSDATSLKGGLMVGEGSFPG